MLKVRIRNKDSFFAFENILLFFYLCMRLNPNFQSDSVLYSAVPVLLSLVLLLNLYIKRELSITKVLGNSYVRWIVFFTVFSILSFLWSIMPATSNVNFFAINIITMIPFALYVTNEKRLENVLKIFIAATLLTCSYMFLFTDVSMMSIEGANRLGSIEEGWNSNAIGLMCSLATVFCLYLYSERKNTKVIYLLCICVFVTIVLLTGSRSAFLRLIMCWLLYIIFCRPRGNTIYFFIALLIGIFTVYLALNVSFLYSKVGIRIETVFNLITGSGNVDSSTKIRLAMIENGIYWFKQKPIIGFGIDNFRFLWEQIAGYQTYAHSNYVDLLVGVGLIGTFIYYSFYVKQIKVLKKCLKKRRKLSAVFLAVISTLLILDLITVTYNSRISQIVLCLVYCGGFIATNSNINTSAD
jgi:O-antigen ligase